jgi:hypothetical protein
LPRGDILKQANKEMKAHKQEGTAKSTNILTSEQELANLLLLTTIPSLAKERKGTFHTFALTYLLN